MNFAVIDCVQRSDEWRAARCGRLTGSNAVALYKNGRGGKESLRRANLRTLLVSERLTGIQAKDDFDTRALARGREKEPLALGMWEAETGLLVQRTGFISGELMVGASLDAHVGYYDEKTMTHVIEGVLELKAPDSDTHTEYLLTPTVVPEDYLPQLRHNVWLTGAKWGEFVSFDDRLKDEALHMLRIRLTRAELEVDAYDKLVRTFLAEVTVEYNQILESRKAA